MNAIKGVLKCAVSAASAVRHFFGESKDGDGDKGGSEEGGEEGAAAAEEEREGVWTLAARLCVRLTCLLWAGARKERDLGALLDILTEKCECCPRLPRACEKRQHLGLCCCRPTLCLPLYDCLVAETELKLRGYRNRGYVTVSAGVTDYANPVYTALTACGLRHSAALNLLRDVNFILSVVEEEGKEPKCVYQLLAVDADRLEERIAPWASLAPSQVRGLGGRLLPRLALPPGYKYRCLPSGDRHRAMLGSMERFLDPRQSSKR